MINGNNWKRKIEPLTCPSGQVVKVRRPGPEFTLKAGKVARTFTQVRKAAEGQGEQEYGLDIIASMSDEELAAVMIFARELVCAMLVSPKLVKQPINDDEIGPDDIPDNDFWFLFNHGMTGFFNLRVPVGTEEVEVSDLTSFRRESGVSGHSLDGADVRADTEQPAGDQGLVTSA